MRHHARKKAAVPNPIIPERIKAVKEAHIRAAVTKTQVQIIIIKKENNIWQNGQIIWCQP